MKSPVSRALDPKTLRMATGAIAGVLLLGGLWLGHGAWQQHQAASAQGDVQAAQAAIVAASNQDVKAALAELKQRVDSEAVRVPAAAGDLAGATTALQQGWKGVNQVQVLPSDLDLGYTTDKPSWSHLALMETALQNAGARASAVREGSAFQLAVASPIMAGEQVVGVAYAQVPMKATLDAANQAEVGDGGYVVLRQGSFPVVEKGDKSLATSGEAKTETIKQSGLSVAGATLGASGGPLGLGFIGGLVGAVVLLVLAGLAAMAPKLIKPRAPVVVEEDRMFTPSAAILAANQPRVAKIEVVDTESVAEVVAEAEPVVALFPAGLTPGAIDAAFDPATAVKLGQQLGAALHARGITSLAMGHDGRDASQALFNGIAEGLVAAGRRVHELGHVPTPVISFAAQQLDAGASVAVVGNLRSITATGLLVAIGGKYLDEAELNALAQGGPAYTGAAGAREMDSVDAPYLQQLTDAAELPRPVVVSVAGEHKALLTRALERHGVVVAETGHEIELALADNGSALSLIDSRGMPLAPSKLLWILAADLLDRAPGADIVTDAPTAEAIAGAVLAKGGIVKVAGPGIAEIQAMVVDTGAALGGDNLGHAIVVDRGLAMPDGLLASLRLVEILAFVDHADDILGAA